MANKIVVNCFQHQDCEWFLGADLFVEGHVVAIQDGLVADTESLDNMVTLYQGIADGLGIPMEVDQDVNDLRAAWELEENA